MPRLSPLVVVRGAVALTVLAAAARSPQALHRAAVVPRALKGGATERSSCLSLSCSCDDNPRPAAEPAFLDARPHAVVVRERP